MTLMSIEMSVLKRIRIIYAANGGYT